VMILFALIGIGLFLAFVPAGAFGVRRHQKPAELRGDWWSQFEADFRAYATRIAAAPGHANRPQAPRRQPPA
jgi:hypothetical protein